LGLPSLASLSFCWWGLLAMSLTGCDRINWPHIYGPDEVPQSVRDADRPVPSMQPTPTDTAYPRVGDVPSHPKTFSSQSDIDKTKQQMDQDREEAEILKRQVQNPTVP